MLLQENVFTPKEFMDELSKTYNLTIYPAEIEYLLDLPSGTLTPKNLIYFNHSLQIRNPSNKADDV